ncbi:hypothetical protein [Spirillospora albida]|uniref:hypothetical protein n=1 Tax=Spirillospora albida TaxID=58123 RepID=UPI0004C271B2|nr:hypothetical protein [Spirillospora albida]
MRFGPRDPNPEPDDPEPGEQPPPQAPHPGDVHVAGSGQAPDPAASSDWVHVPPASTGGRHERPDEFQEPWTPPEPGETPPDPAPDEPFLPGKGLSADPPPSATRPDIAVPRAREPAEDSPSWPAGLAADPPPPAPGPMDDPERRRALADAFVAEFVGSTTWRATLAVLEGAFPGVGMAATLARRTDELWRTMEPLDQRAAAVLCLPAWLDASGMVVDLSAHLHVRSPARPPARTRPPRASRPYAGAFVIDTLDPLRYHRAVGGPRAPRDLPTDGAAAPPGEEDDSGVVIVANLTSAGVRVLDSVALWRYAGRVVTDTLHDPLRPDTRARARRALRALRRVVLVDPDLRLGLCLQLDATRTPRCLLAFAVDRTDAATPHFIRP